MHILTVVNQKGGVGKSTTALNIGAALTLNRLKVLFIDMDPQGNLSYTAGAGNQNGSIFEVLQDPQSIKSHIQETAQGDIIASSPALATADTSIAETGKEYRLKEALDLVTNEYDFVIIDTPPALGILTVNALTASHGAVIPAQADIYSLQGISQLYKSIQPIKKYCNSSLEVYGILFTRYNSRAIISQEVAELTEQTARQLNTKLYKAKIRECTAIKEAQAKRESIFTYAPRSNAAIDYANFINELLKDIQAHK